MKNNNSSTVRETFLQTELDRIRSTYSFRLGLLLTNSIVRKPWMAIFLPFTFLKMNVNFLRDRKARKLSGENPISRVGGNCLMLITASEEGVSASERTISIAKAWLKQKDHKVVVVSTNENLTSMTIQGVSHYQIPDPKICKHFFACRSLDIQVIPEIILCIGSSPLLRSAIRLSFLRSC